MTPVEKDHAAGFNGAVAAVLRGERAASGLTLEQLAEKTEIPQVSLQRYLQAKRAIDMAVLHAIAEALGLEPREIITSAEGRLGRDQRYRVQGEAARNEGDEEEDD